MEFETPEDIQQYADKLASARKYFLIAFVCVALGTALLFTTKAGAIGTAFYAVGVIIGLFTGMTYTELREFNKVLQGLILVLLFLPLTNLVMMLLFAYLATRGIAESTEALRKARLRAHKARQQAAASAPQNPAVAAGPRVSTSDTSNIYPIIKFAGLPDLPEFSRLRVRVDTDSAEPVGAEPLLVGIKGVFGVMYARDTGNQFQYLNADELSALGLTTQALHAKALSNLARKLRGENGQTGLRTQHMTHATGLVFDGHLEASLVLLDSLWENALKKRLPNGAVVCIVAPDICAFCDSQSPEGLAELRGMSERVSSNGDHLITTDLFARQPDGRWVRYQETTRHEATQASTASSPAKADVPVPPANDTLVETIQLQGFEPEGEPVIRRMASGAMWLVFNFMPPLWLSDDDGDAPEDMGPCENFDAQLQQAIGTPVHWDDREFFLISRPLPDTPARIQAFLTAFRSQHTPR